MGESTECFPFGAEALVLNRDEIATGGWVQAFCSWISGKYFILNRI